MLTNVHEYVNELGLVPMRITYDGGFAPYINGQIYGFPPELAEDYYLRKLAKPVDPKDIQQPLDVQVEEPKQLAPAPVNLVPIPQGWEDQHHLQIVRLAKAVAATDREMNTDEARVIIRTEVERRKGL